MLRLVAMQCSQAEKWGAESSPGLFHAVQRVYNGAKLQILRYQSHSVGALRMLLRSIPTSQDIFPGAHVTCKHFLSKAPSWAPCYILSTYLLLPCPLIAVSPAWLLWGVNSPQGVRRPFTKEMGALCTLHPCPAAKNHPFFRCLCTPYRKVWTL